MIVPTAILSIATFAFQFLQKAVLGALLTNSSNVDFEFSIPISSNRSPKTYTKTLLQLLLLDIPQIKCSDNGNSH